MRKTIENFSFLAKVFSRGYKLRNIFISLFYKRKARTLKHQLFSSA